MTDIELLPRADIPVLFNDFKCKADAVWSVAETLVVTDVTQKEAMALARKTRLTLREIRIAVEHKRVELGEGHLKEIQKVNGAAKAIREFIEPLEARLLIQETFNERVEAIRIAALSKSRFDEVEAIKPRAVWVPAALAAMSQEEYEGLVARLRDEVKELEAANRLRIEAEKRLAEQAIEMRRQEEEFLARLQAEKVAENARLEANRVANEARFAAIRAEEKAEQDRATAIAEAKALEVYADLKRKNEAEHAIRVIEALRLENERAVRDADAAEQKRIRDEQYAKLEAELAQANAAKRAEAEAARKLALAPDVEKLRAYRQSVKDLPVPSGLAPDAERCFTEAVYALAQGLRILDQFCERNTI